MIIESLPTPLFLDDTNKSEHVLPHFLLLLFLFAVSHFPPPSTPFTLCFQLTLPFFTPSHDFFCRPSTARRSTTSMETNPSLYCNNHGVLDLWRSGKYKLKNSLLDEHKQREQNQAHHSVSERKLMPFPLCCCLVTSIQWYSHTVDVHPKIINSLCPPWFCQGLPL